MTAFARLRAGFLPGGPTLRHLLALLAGFREPDGDRLLATLHRAAFATLASFSACPSCAGAWRSSRPSWRCVNISPSRLPPGCPVGNAARLNLLPIRGGSTCSRRNVPFSGACARGRQADQASGAACRSSAIPPSRSARSESRAGNLTLPAACPRYGGAMAGRNPRNIRPDRAFVLEQPGGKHE